MIRIKRHRPVADLEIDGPRRARTSECAFTVGRLVGCILSESTTMVPVTNLAARAALQSCYPHGVRATDSLWRDKVS